MLSKEIANVWLPGGRNRAYPTTPGRHLKFFGGHAVVFTQSDMPHVLQMPDAQIEIRAEYRDWLGDWLEHCGLGHEVRATYWIEGEKEMTPEQVDVLYQNAEQAAFGKHKTTCECRLCVNYRKRLVERELDKMVPVEA